MTDRVARSPRDDRSAARITRRRFARQIVSGVAEMRTLRLQIAAPR
jgi:hypothetical protein